MENGGVLVVGFVCFLWLSLVSGGAYISSEKNRGALEGIIFALVLGPLGLLIAALLPTKPAMTLQPRGTGSRSVYPIDDGPAEDQAEEKALEFIGSLEPPRPKPKSLDQAIVDAAAQDPDAAARREAEIFKGLNVQTRTSTRNP